MTVSTLILASIELVAPAGDAVVKLVPDCQFKYNCRGFDLLKAAVS